MSPMIWNIIADTLLTQFKGTPIKVIGYADDVLLMISGKYSQTMTTLMQKALKKVTYWGELNGLTCNPTKTNAMLFSMTYKKQFIPLRMQ